MMLSICRATLGLALATLTLPALAARDKLQQHMLNKMDASKAGVINLNEFQPRHKDRITQADINQDGGISMAEMQARQTQKIAEHQTQMAKHRAGMEVKFTTMDIDKDGEITPEEARPATLGLEHSIGIIAVQQVV